MVVSTKIRLLAAFLAALIGLAFSMSGARSDETPHGPLNAPSPAPDPGHHEAESFPDMERTMAGGNTREYSDGDKLTYRIKVTQTLQAKGPQPADPRNASLEMVLVETTSEDGEGPVVTLEVTEASAEGFLAEAEKASALERKVRFRPGTGSLELLLHEESNGKPDLANAETTAAYGQRGAIRMVDMALKAHLLNPVIPSEDYAEGDSFKDTGALPASWAGGYQPVDGSITMEGTSAEGGRDSVRVKGVHISGDNLLRVRAIDNAPEALQGKEKPVQNDFFAGTLFHALFPKGSTYESLMPKLPLETAPQPRRRAVKPRRRPRRGAGLLLGCLMLLGLAACADPSRNVDIVSLNVDGPMQIDHQSVLDEATGVLVSSRVEAAVRLSGKVYPIPENVLPLLPPHLRDLSSAEIGMDADWTITEKLEGDVPEPSAFASFAPKALIFVGAALLVLALVLFLRRKTRAQSSLEPESAEKPAPAESD